MRTRIIQINFNNNVYIFHYFMSAWLNGCTSNTKKRNENKNDFIIDFFNLTRHFLFTQMELKAVAETISLQI